MSFSYNYCGCFSILDFYPGMDVYAFLEALRKITEQNIILQKQDYYDLRKIYLSLSKVGFDCSVEDGLLVVKMPICFKYFHQVKMEVYIYYDVRKGYLSYIKLCQKTYSQKSSISLYNTILFIFEHRIKTFDSLFKWDEVKEELSYFASNDYYNLLIDFDTNKEPLEIFVLLGINDASEISNKKYFALIEKVESVQRKRRLLELKLMKYDKAFLTCGLQKRSLQKVCRKLKCFLFISIVTFCIGFLMIGFAIGRLSSSSNNAEADAFQTAETAGGNVYVSDSPGSKRYHKDRNCPALKRTTGKITATDEANAIDQGKTLCGWCGK